MGKNIDLVLKGKQPVAVKGMPVDVFFVATGRGRGAGRVGSVKVPSLMVWFGKGRTLGTQYLPDYVSGAVA